MDVHTMGTAASGATSQDNKTYNAEFPSGTKLPSELDTKATKEKVVIQHRGPTHHVTGRARDR
eukprot:12934109-Prorocentrum_lima.AAC.1